MRITHNLAAMNTYRGFLANNAALGKNLEKISSGYRVNRAGDDAAGLAISEKMRAQLTGLRVAQKNAKDGVSLVQTAEGALTEVHGMLNRMYSLAEQSANGTYESGVDRTQLQKEVTALKSEIDRIADSANFNGIRLLGGSLTAAAGVSRPEEATVSGSMSTEEIGARAAVYVLSGAEEPYINYGNILIENHKDLTDNAVVLPVGTKLRLALDYTDAEGQARTVEKTLVAVSETQLCLEDGEQYYALKGSADAALTHTGGRTGTGETPKYIAAALNTDETFSGLFTVFLGDTGNYIDTRQTFTSSLTFVSRTDGAGKESVTGIRLTRVAPGADEGSATRILSSTTSVFAKVRATGVDAATAYDMSSCSVMAAGAASVSDAAKRLSNALFVINGEKFVFARGNLNDNDLAALREAKANVVHLTGSSVTATDVGKMARLVHNLTGLEVTQGAITQATVGIRGVDCYGLAMTNTERVINLFEESAAGTYLRIQAPAAAEPDVSGAPLRLQIGDTGDAFNRMEVEIADMHVKSLGIKDDGGKIVKALSSVDIGTQDGAQAACDVLKAAINQVSDTRGGLGAIQNRLEHTINSLGVMQENLQSAESVIRDTDVAGEMLRYAKNSILNQTAQSMLAQANQLPQGVLQLIQ